MIDLAHLKGQTVAVLGLGKSGASAARALAAGGASVLAWDDARTDAVAGLDGVTVSDLGAVDFGKIAMMVLSPGIPRRHPAPHPAVTRAEAAGCAIVSDIDLLAQARPGSRYLGVTGTNGKSTTTALIGHILNHAGLPAQIGGNLGMPALTLKPLDEDGWYVLELSSYQLETLTAPRFEIGVLINVAPDHLDRYAGIDDYADAKRHLFALQPDDATAVVGIDDRWSSATREALGRRGRRRVVPISVTEQPDGGVYVEDGRLIDATAGAPRAVLDLREVPTLPGVHNWQNAAAAYAAASAADLPASVIVGAMRSFPGLRHRQELVGTLDGLRYVNDSKATNPDAAARALACYDRIYWIAGGLAKQGGLDSLTPHLGRIAHAFLVGEATEQFAGFLDGAVPYQRCGDVATAVAAAHAQTVADGVRDAVVLLSPACASWDQFTNFEARGDAFVAAVRALARRSNGARSMSDAGVG